MSTYEGDTATCALCERRFALDAILDHLRIVHDVDATPAEWPDGGVVIVDTTLEPSDFEDSNTGSEPK